MNTVQVKKIVLSTFGDERYLVDDVTESYAFGHYKTGVGNTKMNEHEKLMLTQYYNPNTRHISINL